MSRCLKTFREIGIGTSTNKTIEEVTMVPGPVAYPWVDSRRFYEPLLSRKLVSIDIPFGCSSVNALIRGVWGNVPHLWFFRFRAGCWRRECFKHFRCADRLSRSFVIITHRDLLWFNPMLIFLRDLRACQGVWIMMNKKIGFANESKRRITIT